MIELAQILVIDRHPLARHGLASLITEQPDLEMIAEASDAAEAIPLIERHAPDVVVLEISQRQGSGMDLLRQIRSQFPETRVLVVSSMDEAIYAPRVLKAGAAGFVSKDEPCETVLEALFQVLKGRMFFSSQLADSVADTQRGKPDFRALLASLSDREMEVFELIGHGVTTAKIARRLRIAANTVESHRHKIKKKLKLKSGAELNRRAIQWTMEK